MFWILVSVLIVIALVIVVLPLLRVPDFSEISREDQNIVIAKDKLAELKKQCDQTDISEEQFAIAKGELENSLALDLENHKKLELHQGGRWLIVLLLLAIPLSSIAIYNELGNPDLLDPKAKLAELQNANKSFDKMTPLEILDYVKKRLKENPNDAEGWFILGRTFMNAEKYPEAATAYGKAYELVGDKPGVMLSLADAIAMTKDGTMAGKPEQLVTKALEIEPNNQIGLWLGGLAAEQRKDMLKAHELWTRLLPSLVGNPQSYNEVKLMLADIEAANPQLATATAVVEVTKPMASTGMQVTLLVSIDEDIKKTLLGNELVFVYAKAVRGPPMPLAARRLKVSDLPINITLSDADAMMPQLKLSSVDSFTVGARVSMNGNPIPQKGDIYMEVSPLDKDSIDQPIELIINTFVD